MAPSEVLELRYRAIGSCQFEAPEPLSIENELGSFLLANDVLRARPKKRMSLEEARREIEPFLRAWELEAELRYGPYTITFEFDDHEALGDAVENTPRKTSPRKSIDEESSGDALVLVMKYPEPPTIRLNDQINLVWSRYKTGHYGLEPLQSWAYYCLTVIERSAGGRLEATKLYRVDPAILRKLGELTSIRGDSTTARKALPSEAAPLSKGDERWIGYAIRAIVFQMGSVAAGLEPELLRLADLPTLGA